MDMMEIHEGRKMKKYYMALTAIIAMVGSQAWGSDDEPTDEQLLMVYKIASYGRTSNSPAPQIFTDLIMYCGIETIGDPQDLKNLKVKAGELRNGNNCKKRWIEAKKIIDKYDENGEPSFDKDRKNLGGVVKEYNQVVGAIRARNAIKREDIFAEVNNGQELIYAMEKACGEKSGGMNLYTADKLDNVSDDCRAAVAKAKGLKFVVIELKKQLGLLPKTMTNEGLPLNQGAKAPQPIKVSIFSPKKK